MGTIDAIGRGPVRAHDLSAEGEGHLIKKKGHDPKEERMSIDHPGIGEGGIPPLHHTNEQLKVGRKTGMCLMSPNQYKRRRQNLNK